MKFYTSYIIIVAILGLILLYSYYYFGSTSNNVQQLWGKVKGNLLNIYYISMLLSALGFLFLFYYLLVSKSLNNDQINKLFISLILILVMSMIWMPLSLYYLKNKKTIYKYLIYLVLFIVAISILYFILVLNSVQEVNFKTSKLLAMIGMIYFFIHCFFFDFLLWTHNFF